LPDGVSAAQIDVVIEQCGGRLLESVAIFDEFHGKEAEGRSVAWRLVFRAPNRTLRDAEVDAAMTKILEGLERQLGVERR
jgi:phenylalanyl-tRNA synthetase beta chain